MGVSARIHQIAIGGAVVRAVDPGFGCGIDYSLSFLLREDHAHSNGENAACEAVYECGEGEELLF
jgi:hypothetical protein